MFEEKKKNEKKKRENICHNQHDQSKIILCFVPITQSFVFKRYNSDF